MKYKILTRKALREKTMDQKLYYERKSHRSLPHMMKRLLQSFALTVASAQLLAMI